MNHHPTISILEILVILAGTAIGVAWAVWLAQSELKEVQEREANPYAPHSEGMRVGAADIFAGFTLLAGAGMLLVMFAASRLPEQPAAARFAPWIFVAVMVVAVALALVDALSTHKNLDTRDRDPNAVPSSSQLKRSSSASITRIDSSRAVTHHSVESGTSRASVR